MLKPEQNRNMNIEMNAMILAAGLGTRLRPWTLEHPKALVPVGGVPMLERVLKHIQRCGFDKIVVNVHHFANQIIEFLAAHEFGKDVAVSDESERLLDTGGGILKAVELVGTDNPLLIHNVDILSNADLPGLAKVHMMSGNDVTLLTSDRESSRKLMFDANGMLQGWHDLKGDCFRLSDSAQPSLLTEEGFSGIYIIGGAGFGELRNYANAIGNDAFPIMDFLLSFPAGVRVGRHKVDGLDLIDIGKPETLAYADYFSSSSL